MTVTLPTDPRPRDLDPYLMSQRQDMTSIINAATQRRERTGDRWGFTVVLPPMTEANAIIWRARLLRAADTCVLELPEPGITIGSPGTPLVNGGSQTGSTLVTDGWTASYVIKEGKWIAVSVSSLIYLYMVTADTTASGAGAASIPIQPMIRTSPADNAALIISPAKVEGYVTIEGGLNITVERLMQGCTFRIEERK